MPLTVGVQRQVACSRPWGSFRAVGGRGFAAVRPIEAPSNHGIRTGGLLSDTEGAGGILAFLGFAPPPPRSVFLKGGGGAVVGKPPPRETLSC